MADTETILVIDDEIGPRESIRMLLKERYAVIPASSGQEGLEVLRSRPVDLVILDLKMQEMDGLQTLEEIRKMNSSVSVIILTGYGTIEAVKKAIRFGAIELVSKPFDVAEMVKHVESALSQKKGTA